MPMPDAPIGQTPGTGTRACAFHATQSRRNMRGESGTLHAQPARRGTVFSPLSSAMPMATIFYAAHACAAAWSTCSGGRVSASAAAVPASGLGLLASNSPFSTSDPELCASKSLFVSLGAGRRASDSFFLPPEFRPSTSDAVFAAPNAGLRTSASAFATSDLGLWTSDPALRTVCPLPLVLAFTGSGPSVSRSVFGLSCVFINIPG